MRAAKSKSKPCSCHSHRSTAQPQVVTCGRRGPRAGPNASPPAASAQLAPSPAGQGSAGSARVYFRGVWDPPDAGETLLRAPCPHIPQTKGRTERPRAWHGVSWDLGSWPDGC